MDIAAGSRLTIEGQRYRVEDRLGSGSQGQVFQGRADNGELVALKFITDPRRRHREADILRGWSSEHVVGLKGQGQYANGEVLVMDLVDGLTLQRLQEICSRLERGLHPALALQLISHVASGLQEGYCTTRLKVHRDIKPSNVMIGRDGKGKILDFGIAYGLDLTCTGTPVATPLYMAPEQMEGARPAEELDHRTDQYSLGLLLAELVLGRPLRPMERDALARWLFVPGAELDAARDQVGRQAPEVFVALERMLAWEPESRYDSMADVVVALEAARAKCEAPETLESFAARLISLSDQGQLPDRSDPALRVIKVGRPSTSETILPDMTGVGLPKAPTASRVLSPAMERQGPMNLADLRVLGTAPDGVGSALYGEVRVAQPVVDSLPPSNQGLTATGRALTATVGWYQKQKRKRGALVAGSIFAMVVFGAGAVYFSGDVKPETTAASDVAPTQVVHRERVVRPKAIPPIRKTQKKPATSAAAPSEVAAKATKAENKDEVKVSEVAPEVVVASPEKIETVEPAEPAHDPNWRRAGQMMAFEGDAEEKLPVEVMPEDRPGLDIDDEAQAETEVEPGDSEPSLDPVEPIEAVAVQPAEAESIDVATDQNVEATDQEVLADQEAATDQAEPIESTDTTLDIEGAAIALAEEGAIEVVDPNDGEAVEGAELAPADRLVEAADHHRFPSSPVQAAAEEAAGYELDSAKTTVPEDIVAIAALPVQPVGQPEVKPEEAAVSAIEADTESLPARPGSFSDRRWARQLAALGLAARHAGQENRALMYLEAARDADPSWTVASQILSGHLDHLPPEPTSDGQGAEPQG